MDDTPQVRHELRVLLELTGAVKVVGEAADGREAVHQAEQLHPDVVVMDLVMPELDGSKATREIKERGLTGGVVILSVHGDEESLARARAAAADAFVSKGAPLEILLGAVKGAK